MKNLLTFLLHFSCVFAHPQTKPFWALESALTFDHLSSEVLYQSDDFPLEKFRIKSVPSFAFGIMYGKTYLEKFQLEGGVVYKQYRTSLLFQNASKNQVKILVKLNDLIQIPIRLSYHFKIPKSNLILMPGIGFHLGLTMFNTPPSIHYKELSINSFSFYNYANFNSIHSNLRHPFFLFESSLGVGLYLNKSVFISLHSFIISGFRTMHNGYSYIETNNNLINFSYLASNGTGDYFGLNIKLLYYFKKLEQ